MAQVKQISPNEAAALLAAGGVVYIDVRTEVEFQNGHVPGAVNIPVVFPDPVSGQMAVNAEFLDVVKACCEPASRIVVGCQAGGRSQFAADMLVESGFADVCNMQGGFGGAKDPFGRMIVKGWVELGLPIESVVPAQNAYESRRRAAGK